MAGEKVLETAITKKIIKALNQLDRCLVYKRLAGPHRKGKPDITGCINGCRIEIEVKLPGGEPTPKQQQWLDRWDEVGAITGCVTSVEEALDILKRWINAKGVDDMFDDAGDYPGSQVRDP